MFNYDIILKVMPYEIPAKFVDLLIELAKILKKKLFSNEFEGKDKVKHFC